MVRDDILHKYRRLIVNDVPGERFIQYRYRITPNHTSDPPLEIRGAAIRLLLILSQRTIVPLGFEDVRKSDIDTIGAVLVPPGPSGTGSITIALPLHIASRREGLTQLLLTATSASEYHYTSEIWLEDIVLPPTVMQWFKGPRLGVEGVRSLLGIENRPLLGYVVKSRTGASLSAVINSCWQALAGGVDLLVDDLLATDPDGPLSFDKRVGAICELVRQFNATTAVSESRRVGYLVNVGASAWKAEEYMVAAQTAGAFGCLVDCFTMGFGNVQELIERAEQPTNTPLAFFATNMGSGMMGRNPDDERLGQPEGERRFLRTGFSETLTAKLSRLAGADGVHTGSVGSECFEIAEYAHTPRALRPSADILRPSFAVTEGDIQFTQVPDNVLEMGTDIVIETASGIANHPAGVEQGARAYRLLVGCLSDDLTRDDVDEIVNLLRHRFPEVIEPVLGKWKLDHDERIRSGWNAETSVRALSAVDATEELKTLMSQRGRRANA